MTVYLTVKLDIETNDVEHAEEILHNMDYGFEYLNRFGENLISYSEIVEQEIVVL